MLTDEVIYHHGHNKAHRLLLRLHFVRPELSATKRMMQNAARMVARRESSNSYLSY